MQNLFPMHAISEADIEAIVRDAGGERAHPDADSREAVGADFLIGGAVIELSLLAGEGFDKPERQAKLAKLFLAAAPERPVVVLDPANLDQGGQRTYRSIVEGPIKSAAADARDQLVQSRSEFGETTGSVLWVVNNGYMALDHDALEEIVANRVRQDTRQIDSVIVSGCYYHSDGFDGVVLWPMTYVAINASYNSVAFHALHDAWQAFYERFMTDVVMDKQTAGKKLAVDDIVFEVDGVRYVRPAPEFGQPSDFYIQGRPRGNPSGFEKCPPVALIVPGLTATEHSLVQAAVDEPHGRSRAMGRGKTMSLEPRKPRCRPSRSSPFPFRRGLGSPGATPAANSPRCRPCAPLPTRDLPSR